MIRNLDCDIRIWSWKIYIRSHQLRISARYHSLLKCVFLVAKLAWTIFNLGIKIYHENVLESLWRIDHVLRHIWLSFWGSHSLWTLYFWIAESFCIILELKNTSKLNLKNGFIIWLRNHYKHNSLIQTFDYHCILDWQIILWFLG